MQLNGNSIEECLLKMEEAAKNRKADAVIEYKCDRNVTKSDFFNVLVDCFNDNNLEKNQYVCKGKLIKFKK